MKIKPNEKIQISKRWVLEKVPVEAGDAVFIKYRIEHQPVIKIFKNVVPGCRA